jgi:pimeloyl-ACP methyl ester carboxylesterase
MVQWVKDVRGAMNAPMAVAVEPRIKAAALYSAGYYAAPARGEVEVFNYTPRVRTPTLMLNGRYDTVFPYETSQVPFFNHLGTPTRDKRTVLSENGHLLPLEITVRETVAWFDRYLSGKTAGTAVRE